MRILFAFLLAATAANADKLQQADLAKLLDPALRDAEVARLAGCDKDKRILTGFQFLTAKQKTEGSPLHVLCVSSDYRPLRDVSIYGGYKIDNPEEIFGNIAKPVVYQLEPSLQPVTDSLILVFNSDGKEVRPFGGNNYTHKGYYFDFDHDGILDRADSTNYSVKESHKDSVQVFKVESIELKPRTLLEVIFNWHPNSAADPNDWMFTCFDDNQDGIVEIAFGPASATLEKDQRQLIFRWNPGTQSYSAGELPPHSHVRVMAAGETLASIAETGGLGYPLLKESSNPKATEATPPPPQAPYVFQSLKDRPAAELAAFFQGKAHRDSWSDSEDSFPNRLPEKFWELSPRQAAIALAEANRTPTHRAKWKLALDDRGGIAPPKSGWLLHDWGSSSCYSFSSHRFALRFGVTNPSLIVFEYNSIGVVGRNPWADQPAHNVRVIKLSDQEARFLADTVFWLDRIRTFSPDRDDRLGFGKSSTADGSARVYLFPDGASPRQLVSGTVWATSSISGGWEGDYKQTVYANLAEFLIADSFPATLGERWEVAPDIGRHSLVTPTEERIKPRVDDDNRQRLSDAFTAILQQHAKDPIPAFAIKELVQATGDEMLTDLTIRLRELSSALPPLNAEDHEFETLEKRFANDHFGNSMENKDGKNKEDYARLKELRDKREFLPAAILRTSLSDTLTKLQLSTNAAELKKAVKENGPQSQWALNQFRRLDPNAWSEIIAGQFGNADVESRRAIFSTLAAGSPLAAKKLIEDITPTERFDLIIEIANYHQQQTADSFVNDIPDLMKLIRDRNQNYLRRCSAMPLLTGTKLPPETLKEFTSLLIAEVRNPQQGEYGMGTLDSAITALSMLPDAASHFDLISTLPGINDRSFSLGFEAILRVTKDRPDRQKLLADFIRPRFTRGNGMMNDVFLAALANDLRNLAPEISAFASENPSVENGDGADYSGGSFETPIGQHYHIAREITALWSENDPTTLGRMWIYFVAAHAYSFSQQNQALRDHAAEKIHGLHRDQLGEEINEAIALIKMTKYDSASELWLRDLGRNQ